MESRCHPVCIYLNKTPNPREKSGVIYICPVTHAKDSTTDKCFLFFFYALYHLFFPRHNNTLPQIYPEKASPLKTSNIHVTKRGFITDVGKVPGRHGIRNDLLVFFDEKLLSLSFVLGLVAVKAASTGSGSSVVFIHSRRRVQQRGR